MKNGKELLIEQEGKENAAKWIDMVKCFIKAENEEQSASVEKEIGA